VKEPEPGDRTLDANAVAGMLEDLFGTDMTAADSKCAGCGREGEVGTLLAYTNAPGVVLRCPACSTVMLRMVETPRGRLIEAKGLAYVRLTR
jgi:DNA-directed RNA polymerase subunit RPC12/RpoP